MVNSITRLGFSATATNDHRKLAVELAEVIIKWELYRIKDSGDSEPSAETKTSACGSVKRSQSEDSLDLVPAKRSTNGGPTSAAKIEFSSAKPIEKAQADAVLTFLLRLACQVNEAPGALGTTGEQLSKKCVVLLKTALKPDVWPVTELKLGWMDKIFSSIETVQPNFGNICTAIEILTFLLGVMKREQILNCLKPLQRGLGACVTHSNTKVIKLMHNFLSKLVTIFPTETKYEELDTLYGIIGKFITDGLMSYEKNATATPSSLFGTLMVLKAVCTNNQNYIDRIIAPFMRALHKMAKDHLHPSQAENSQVVSTCFIIASLYFRIFFSDFKLKVDKK